MTDEHKSALAAGREQGRVVRTYLEALEAHKPRRGRKRTSDSISNRLMAIESELPDSDPLRRLQLIQERMGLEAELASMDSDGEDIGALEQEFIRVAADYAGRKGISYQAFREVGVAPSTLNAAGLSRSQS